MNRRRAVIAVVAGAAALTGAGTALWRRRANDDEPAAEAGGDIWSLSFERPGATEALHMKALRGRPLLLNFWATWCAPCVVEMPLLDAFAKAHSASGWRLLALAVDRAEPVRAFAVERGLSMPMALAGAGGVDLSRRLGNTLGALPFSVVFASSGEPAERHLGAVDATLLEAWKGRVR